LKQKDSITYDSLVNRPLPKWLLDQKEGRNTYQPKEIVMKEDRSLEISMAVTGIIIVMTVIILTVVILRKIRNKSWDH